MFFGVPAIATILFKFTFVAPSGFPRLMHLWPSRPLAPSLTRGRAELSGAKQSTRLIINARQSRVNPGFADYQNYPSTNKPANNNFFTFAPCQKNC